MVSIADYRGMREGYSCGYCGHPEGKYATGMWAHVMSAEDYQDLIDRGWRRSGKYVYKPTMHQTCCPQYTIRCHALDFLPNKTHKKVLKKMSKFLAKGDITKGLTDESTMDMNTLPDLLPVQDHLCPDLRDPNISTKEGLQEPSEAIASNQATKTFFGSESKVQKKRTPHPGVGVDPARPLCRKAKDIRRERKRQKLLHGQPEGLKVEPRSSTPSATATASNRMSACTSQTVQRYPNSTDCAPLPSTKQPIASVSTAPTQHPQAVNRQSKLLEEFISDQGGPDASHHLEVKLVRSSPRSTEFEASFFDSIALYRRYQQAVHKDPLSKLSQQQVRLVPSSFENAAFETSFEQSAALFAKYQMAIHKDTASECSHDQFTRFLCDSPLEEEHRADGPSEGYGSFHEQFWLDGKLLAVGVLDILPRCLSSVYFYYDPDYSNLSLGVYSALREIALTKRMHHEATDIRHYYIGYYIHSCPKMRYKAQYRPADLLCPESYHWVQVEHCLPLLDKAKYSRFNTDLSAGDDDCPVSLDHVMVLYNRCAMPYNVYQQRWAHSKDEAEVREYASFVGQRCAERMLLYRG
uniref:arginyl-tRNA--protein transferase 1 isoform X2 n=1 Tax=Myxine glutinosa TaxID=7769 RepID=UPI00358F0FD0